MKEPFTFDKTATIDLPTEGTISTIQANVKRTIMGFGSSARSIEKNNEKTNDASKSITERPPLKRQGHTLVATSKSKRVFFPRVPEVLCTICMIKNNDRKR